MVKLRISDYPVLKCKNCLELWFIDEHGDDQKPKCWHCGSLNLECDHPGGFFSKEKQCFLCSSCGLEWHNNIDKIRQFAINNPHLGMHEIIDIKNH